MTPVQFINKWNDSELRERQGSQEHFIDLCRLLGEPTPAEDDPKGERFCFEKGAEKAGGGDGWADVWRKGCFAWEYKGRHKNLDAAYRQLAVYATALQNPPYLVVCDMERIIIRTNWTNTVSKTFELGLGDLVEPKNLDLLRKVFTGSADLKPGVSPQELTAKVAARFGELGRRLQERKHAPQDVAHFLNRLIFCMFAEDARLLPEGLFTRVVKATQNRPDHAASQLTELFEKMRGGGFFGADVIKWFNGGLFDDAAVLPLEREDLKLIADTAGEHDWSQIDPAVFGSMFEEALKVTGRRAALGAHYTDREKILKIVEPVIIRPLTAEWEEARAAIAAALAKQHEAEARRKAVLEEGAEALKSGADVKAGDAARRKAMNAALKAKDEALGEAKAALEAFLDRLSKFRVLDPACGSGNFLYVALHALRDMELRALVEAERMGLQAPAPRLGLEVVRGIEIERYAAELARVTLWIGDLQWQRKNGFTAYAEPILSSLDQIECRDALLNEDGTEAQWPTVDVIIGNPPFLGDRLMINGLGEQYVNALRSAYDGRVPGAADFVCYWVEKSWRGTTAGAARAGIVATNSIRGGANRKVLEPIAAADAIGSAWADEPWTQDGAAVRVSMVSFGTGFVERQLDGQVVETINADLTSSGVNLTAGQQLLEAHGVAFIGTQKNGPFDIAGSVAREWLKAPLNPNGRPNSDVLHPWVNGSAIVQRDPGTWVIDFGTNASEQQSALYEGPFAHVVEHVRPTRLTLRRDWHRTKWWLHGDPRPALRKALNTVARQIITPRVSKHRIFVWRSTAVLPDSATVSIARDDDTTFGILHSRFHELWSLRMGTWLGVGNDPRYTPSTTFETFPFPEGLTPNIPAADYAPDPRAIAIAEAASRLNELREAWLNPSDLVVAEPEVVPGYPDRVLPRDEDAAKVLKTRTLTNLYNQRPAWLENAHRALDEAVAAAYGWPADLSDEEVLERLFALNQERAAAGR